LLAKYPEKIFKSIDFTSLSEKSLILLIKRDDLQMREIEIWEYKYLGIIDSKIVNLNIASLISRWIDKIDIKSKHAHLRKLYLPYKFNLLLREIEMDSLLKRTEEIIRGYNPLEWKSGGEHAKAKDSFILSFKSKNNFKDSIISNVIDVNYAMNYGENVGPAFDRDIDIYVKWEIVQKILIIVSVNRKATKEG
ncbi:hypothetical protein C1646_685289, partial [Rhizophagus diaphanus]